MTARAALALAALLLALLTLADAYQAQHRPALAVLDPVAGNRAAATLVAQWHAAAGDQGAQDRLGAELCDIANGMHWQDIGPVLVEFLQEEGCY